MKPRRFIEADLGMSESAGKCHRPVLVRIHWQTKVRSHKTCLATTAERVSAVKVIAGTITGARIAAHQHGDQLDDAKPAAHPWTAGDPAAP